jgi:hypothetical protein
MTDFRVRVPPGEPDQVVSVKVIDADLGVGNRRLIVASGIVLVSWRYNSDETFRGQERVWLNIYARELEQWSAFVGLASIANGESGFVFATDSARVEINDGSGELSLVVNDALMGEWSALNRFSYQIVATVVRAATGIAGTIGWPTALFRPETDDPLALQRVLGVVAGHRELITPPGSPQGSFAYERLTPVAAGSLEKLTIGRERCAATYRIANPPMAMPLKVSVSVLEGFGTATSAGRVAGPDVFTLSPTHPAETVDFEIAAWQALK